MLADTIVVVHLFIVPFVLALSLARRQRVTQGDLSTRQLLCDRPLFAIK
jgi:hypothetical protein